MEEWKSMVIQLIGIGYEINIQQQKSVYDRFFAYLKDKTPSKAISSIILQYMVIIVRSVLQDIYAVARMFKRFSGEPEYAKNIIYYAGSKHCEIVKRFLLEVLGFKLEYQTKGISKTDFQCVNIQNLPWF